MACLSWVACLLVKHDILPSAPECARVERSNVPMLNVNDASTLLIEVRFLRPTLAHSGGDGETALLTKRP
jgi:hypothetical protein